MRITYTNEELQEARRLCKKEFDEAWERAARPAPSMEALFARVDAISLLSSGGITPPRHQQIVAYEDGRKLWVGNFGWMDEELWEDIVKCGCSDAI